MANSNLDLNHVRSVFEENFTTYGEIGASVSVWQHGEEVLNLANGWCEKEQQRQWNAQTMIPVYSATKGPASAVVLMLLDENGLTPESRVSQVWENFPIENATFGEMMSHQCGLAALDQPAEINDYEAVVSAIESQQPNWKVGDGHGYHPRTYGFLLDEVVRLLTGERLGKIWYKRIAEVLDIDMFIGLPESEFQRVARLYPGKMDKGGGETEFYKEFNQPGSLVKKAFGSPIGLHAVHQMNSPEAWQSALPAMGGVATATALAKFYQVAIGEIEFFSSDVIDWMKDSQSMADDKVLITPTHFTCGFQKDPLDSHDQKIRHNYGRSLSAFGHPGAGGIHAFGDPDSGISFGYTMNQMSLSVLPGARCKKMIDALGL